MDVDHLATPAATAQAHLDPWVGHQIGLRYLALYAFWQFARQFYQVDALLLDGLRNAQHIGYLQDDTVQLRVKVVVVVDDAQMGVTGPGPVDLLVQVASQLQTLLVGLLIAGGIGGGGIILFGTVGSTHQMQHGIIAVLQLVGRRATLLAQLYPHLRRDIGRDVQRAAVADHKGGLGATLCQSHKAVLQRQLRLQNGQLAFVVELLVGCQVAPAALTVHRGNFGHGKHLEP